LRSFRSSSSSFGNHFTPSLLSACALGYASRISEALALKWSDVDGLNGKLNIERGIVRQIVDDAKSEESRKQFSAREDWIFASPVLLGRLPWSYPWVLRVFGKAASNAGIAHISTHTMRHTHRSWLDAVGTPNAVQQKLMRHADIRTTMNTYREHLPRCGYGRNGGGEWQGSRIGS
jgi:integrase